jgi:hypothetical protein
VLDDAPRGYWRLGETSGTSAADETLTAAGTYFGGVTLGVTGALAADANTAARLDGVNGRVSMGDPTRGTLDFGTGDFSVEAWIKTSVNGGRVIVSKRAASSDPYWVVAVSGDAGHVGELRAIIRAGGTTNQVYGPTIRLDDGAWHHVVVTFDRDTAITLYVDGVVAVRALPTIGDVSNTGNLRIGGFADFSGVVDEVALYPSVLSALRVQAHFDAGR